MRKNRIFALLLALLLATGLLPGASLAAGPVITQGDIVILYTNDVHCSVGQLRDDDGAVTNIGYAGVAAFKKHAEGIVGPERVTLVDAGDAVQGDAIGTLSQGQYLVELMNAVGYDIFVPGNHEFDYGMQRMLALMDRLDAQVISANFVDLATNATVFAPYTVESYGGVRVAFVGITTPEALTASTPAYFQDENGAYIYGLGQGSSGNELYAAVQAAVDAARSTGGADYVIAVGHLGIDPLSAPWRSTDVLANTTGINAFIDGHSHSTVESQTVQNLAGDSVLLTQTGTMLQAMGCMILSPDGSISATLVSGYEDMDEPVDAAVKAMEEAFAEDLAREVATTAVDLTVDNPLLRERMVRSQETNLGDLCADAYRFVLGNGKTGSQSGPADIGMVNAGGIRAGIPAGRVSFGQVIAVHPYNNMGCVVEATGQEILDALEMASRFAPEECGGFLQVSGMRYTIDTAIPSPVMLDENGNFSGVNGPRRVRDVTVGDAALDPEGLYTVASHNYLLLDGGDGISMFRDNPVAVPPVILDNQLLITYIEENLGGVVGREYANPFGQGRITVETAAHHWYDPAVSFVISQGMTQAANNASFGAAHPLTGQGMLALLWALDGGSVDAGPEEMAAWAAERGITADMGGQPFQPSAELTREQMAVMMHRYSIHAAKTLPALQTAAFSDASDCSDWSLESVSALCRTGVVNGDGNGRFAPRRNATRGEAAQVIMNYCKAAIQ